MAKINIEQWLRAAVEQLDLYVFEGGLDLLNHPFQIYFGRVRGKKGGETVQPSDNEDISLEDFFPTTIGVSFETSDMKKLMTDLTYECIKGFMNETKGKKFKRLCERYGFEAPFTSPNPSMDLSDRISDALDATIKQVGEFPGKAVKFPKKAISNYQKMKMNQVTFFCPDCGMEYVVSKKKLKDNQGCPTCICGTKCGRDLEENKEEEK